MYRCRHVRHPLIRHFMSYDQQAVTTATVTTGSSVSLVNFNNDNINNTKHRLWLQLQWLQSAGPMDIACRGS